MKIVAVVRVYNLLLFFRQTTMSIRHPLKDGLSAMATALPGLEEVKYCTPLYATFILGIGKHLIIVVELNFIFQGK